MKLNLPAVVFLVLFLGMSALIVYENEMPDMAGQTPTATLAQVERTATPSQDSTESQEDITKLTDDEIREKVLPANDL